jgi:serine/threonine-protein kinase
MEVLNGDTLESVLERRGRIPVAEACGIMVQVLATLSAAHELDIVHRDLKPANVMLTYPRPGRAVVKVLDFGIAQGIHGVGPEINEKGLIIGTPQYMAPEQALGTPLDRRCDLYAAGAILYELLSGVPAIHGDALETILVNVMTVEPEPLSEVVAGIPPKLEALVMAALEKKVERRPRTAGQMIDAIEPFADKLASMAPRRSESPMPLITKRAATEPAPAVTEPAPAARKPTSGARSKAGHTARRSQKLELVMDSTVPPPGDDDAEVG